jgi:hypothetical protein
MSKNELKNKKRLERAKSQGFDLETIWYHVTDSKIDAFDINKTQDGCIWLTKDKDAAISGELGAAGATYVMPLYIRASKLAGWDEYDKLSSDQIMQDNFDGIELDNDVMLFYPQQIRSINADFLDVNFNSTTLNDSEKAKKKKSKKLM